MAELQCHISGGILAPKVEGPPVQFGRVYCDGGRNLWVTDAALQRVFYFNQQEIAHRQKEFELHFSASHTSQVSTALFVCKREDETILSIMHSTFSTFRLTLILTTKGTLSVFYADRDDDSSAPVLLREWQLATEMTSVVMAHSSTSSNEVQFFAGCFDGVYGEVIIVSLAFDAQLSPAPPAAAALSATLDARGIFRIKGRLSQLLWRAAGADALLLSVSHDGNIDVWDWNREEDATQRFGGISWDVAAHGALSDGGALLHDSKLWLPTDRGTLIVLPFTASQTTPSALLLEAHSGPIRQLLRMSGGRYIWSYAEGGRVSVWDTEHVSFKGSFLFPECRIANLACADVELVTHLWAVDGETGGLASLVANESIQGFDGKVTVSSEAMRRAEEGRSSVEKLHAVLDSASRELRALGLDPLTAAPTEGGSDADEKAEALVRVVQDYAASAKLLSSFFGGGEAIGSDGKTQAGYSGLEERVTDLIATCRDASAAEGDVQDFCSSVCMIIDENRELTSLHDVLEALSDWKEDLQTRDRKEEVEPVGNDTVPFKDVIAQLEKELRERDVYTTELDRRIVELLSEQRELSVQLERTQQSLSDRDQQIHVLQRTADTAKKAAELASADAAQLFELEACLHAAREKEAQLEGELARLRPREERFQQCEDTIAALEQRVASYERKEKLAAHAIEDFISVQNNLFEEVTGLVDWLSSGDADGDAPATPPNGSDEVSAGACRERLVLLETHLAEKVSQQKRYFSLLRSEYETTDR
ncbi:hypothetical protein STCU_07901 [Strigomonas culicis]|uniref:Uncharacterized protein n=1 Tax=Strigomonas culicis TaxID=28005 RepID=S9TX47_9TRYP|nr:hypothetical protein STCU_07901 [Strigomonas culicis]|eukprot:EPY23057.1 hypothetical protein STCU_07901 [Strigomonas culicis]